MNEEQNVGAVALTFLGVLVIVFLGVFTFVKFEDRSDRVGNDTEVCEIELDNKTYHFYISEIGVAGILGKYYEYEIYEGFWRERNDRVTILDKDAKEEGLNPTQLAIMEFTSDYEKEKKYYETIEQKVEEARLNREQEIEKLKCK